MRCLCLALTVHMPSRHAPTHLQRLPKSSWRDVRYRGDPMLRPIGSLEVALLARLLVGLSNRLNAALGLSWQQQQAQRGGGGGGGGGADPAADGGADEPPEHRLQELVGRARRRGWRVNLRPLADVRNLAWIPIAYLMLAYGLRFLIWLVVAIASGPASEGGGGGGGGAQRQHYPQHQHHH